MKFVLGEESQETASNNFPGLIRNLSFENLDGFTYHEKYYFPRLVWKQSTCNNQDRSCDRMDEDHSELNQFEASEYQPEYSTSVKKTKIDLGSTASSADCRGRVNNPSSASAAAPTLSPFLLQEGQQLQDFPEDKVRSPSIMSDAGSSDTIYSEDYTRMTDVGEGSDVDSHAHKDNHSVSTSSGDEFSDHSEANSFTTLGDEKESSPQISDSFKGISIDGMKKSIGQGNPANLTLDMNSVDGLPDQPPSPDTNFYPEDNNNEPCIFYQGQVELPTEYQTYEGGSFEDREFDFLKAEPIKRSTSLKTYKTPPGTPHRKKGVRFADALGLDLESVRHILNIEAPPKIPATALKDLKVRKKCLFTWILFFPLEIKQGHLPVTSCINPRMF